MPSNHEKARAIHTADGGIILDVENGKMFSLNSSGSAIFQLLEQGLPEEQIVKELVKRFGIPADVAKRDVSDFCSSLENRNLLITSPNRVPEAVKERADNATKSWRNAARPGENCTTGDQPRLAGGLKFRADRIRNGASAATEIFHEGRFLMRFLVLRAYLALLRFEILLARGNFAALYDVVRRSPCSHRRYNTYAIGQICSAVDLACIWYWKEALCLQRSAALTCLLKRFGVPAQMVIGTQHIPFKSHAWVEVDGRVVNDKPYVSEVFAVLDRC